VRNDLIIILIVSGLGLLAILAALFFFLRPRKDAAKPAIIRAEPKEASQSEAFEITKEIAKPAVEAPAKATAHQSPPPPSAPTEAPWEKALRKSRDSLFGRLKDALLELGSNQPWSSGHPLWERMEEGMLAADMGPAMTERLLDALKQDFREKPAPDALKEKLREKMLAVFSAVPERQLPTAKPFVTILIGVNGAGKTTTAGKLAAQAKAQGKKVVLGAGDTFRAAAVEQLKTWADRLEVECIVPAQGANPAAVAFDTVAAGLAREADEVILDTAGRLHTKENLMEELRKVVRVIQKKIPDAPHRVLLVLDATLGQNALIQAKEFNNAVPATGVVLTKLDGSAKGGAAFTVSADLGLPIAYVGVGESSDDLRPFSAPDFVRNLIP
jgi:fused signal recognition particle receptor